MLKPGKLYKFFDSHEHSPTMQFQPNVYGRLSPNDVVLFVGREQRYDDQYQSKHYVFLHQSGQQMWCYYGGARITKYYKEIKHVEEE